MMVAFIALMAAMAPTAAALKGVNLVSSNDIITGAVKKSEAGQDSISANEVREETDPGGGLGGAQIKENELGTVPGAAGLAYAGSFNGVDGKLVRGKGVKSSAKTGTGAYQVVFDREAKTCTHLALRDGAEPGQIAAAVDATNASAVNVKTFAADGTTAEDRSFNLALSC
jgi:hypothetical protein